MTSTPPLPARWVDAGLTRHFVFVPALPDLVDPWFRLSFGGSGVARARARRRRSRRSTPASPSARARRTTSPPPRGSTVLMTESMLPSPSFSRPEPEDEASSGGVGRNLGRHGDLPALRRRARRRDRRPHPPLPPAARPARAGRLDRPRGGVDPPERARLRRRRRAHPPRPRLGARARLRDDDDRLADDEPARLALLAAARLSRRRSSGCSARSRSAALPDPLRVASRRRGRAARTPSRSRRPRRRGRRSPTSARPSATRCGSRSPVEPLEAIVPRGGRATILVEPPALPIPGAARDPRQAAIAAASDELERIGVPTERQTLARRGRARPPAGPARDREPRHTRLRAALSRRGVGARRRGPDLVDARATARRCNRALVETDAVVTVGRGRDGAPRRPGVAPRGRLGRGRSRA